MVLLPQHIRMISVSSRATFLNIVRQVPKWFCGATRLLITCHLVWMPRPIILIEIQLAKCKRSNKVFHTLQTLIPGYIRCMIQGACLQFQRWWLIIRMRGRRFQRNRACANSVPPKITPRYLLNLPSSLSHIGAKSPLSIAESFRVVTVIRTSLPQGLDFGLRKFSYEFKTAQFYLKCECDTERHIDLTACTRQYINYFFCLLTLIRHPLSPHVLQI
ncbi:hypothetical protein A0H81_01919 [Grifola frondosa]|uniref:Uncharacterized protein n=1 Tax=Grifola frondosa TaxID=5627 RepID=A0A1C7ML00_GRIFR|nr:hypothetical protein A0H81_01919 [Grifola frondosa]